MKIRSHLPICLFICLSTAFSFKANAQSICCATPDSCTKDAIEKIADSLDKINKQDIVSQINQNGDSLNALTVVHELIDIGQSNMVGESDTSHFHMSPLNTCPDDLRQTFRRVYMQQANGSIVPLKLGSTNMAIGNGSCGPEIGQAYNFELTNKNQNEILVIKKRAVSGIPLANLMKGTTYYDSTWRSLDSIAETWYKANRCHVVTRDVNFAQGESDKNNTKMVYYNKLDTFRSNLIKDKRLYGNSKFIISGIPTNSALFGAGVDSAFKLFVTNHNNIASLIDNNGKGLQSDNVHWTAESYFDIGMEFIVRTFGGKTKSIYTMSSGSNPLLTIDGAVNISSVSLNQLNAANAHSDSLFRALDSICKKLYVKDDSVRDFSGTLCYTRSGGVNTWSLMTANGYTFKGLKNSVTVNGYYIDIALPDNVHTIRPLFAIGGNNNVTNHIAENNTVGAAYKLSFNGFSVGAFVHDDRIRVSIASSMEMQLIASFDSINNVWSKYQPQPKFINLENSYAPTFTYGNTSDGTLWVKISTAGVFLPTEIIDIKPAVDDVRDKSYGVVLEPGYPYENRFKVLYPDGTPVKYTRPPHRLKVLIKWGPSNGFVDPSTYDMGSNAAIPIHGQYKVIN